jgi:hypothetical protein
VGPADGVPQRSFHLLASFVPASRANRAAPLRLNSVL